MRTPLSYYPFPEIVNIIDKYGLAPLASEHDYFLRGANYWHFRARSAGIPVSYYDDFGIGDPRESEYPEPTLEEYCEGYGHRLEDELPDTGHIECHCGTVRVPLEGEPHDEYSAACTDLIDAYHGILIDSLKRNILASGRQLYGDEYSGLRYQLGKILRHKSPAYLEVLIESAKASLEEAGESGPWDEDTLDRYVLLGVHLRHNSMLMLGNTLYRLDGAKDSDGRYLAFTDIANTHLAGVRALARFLTLIAEKNPSGYPLSNAMTVLLPVLERNPEMAGDAAAILNAQGISQESVERTAALLGEGVTSHPSITEGLL